MAILRMTLCAVFVVTMAMSKPLCLSDGEDSDQSSESSESNSLEETAAHVGPSEEALQPAITETDMPTAKEELDSVDAAALLPSADAGPSLATLDTSVLPDPEDPQTSTDTAASDLMPDDPLQSALGVEFSQDAPNSAPAQDSVNTVLLDTEVSLHPGLADTIIGVGGTNQPQATTTTSQRFPQGATPPIIKPTPPPFSTAPPIIPIGTALTGVPVCFTFQFTTPEPAPPRGDSI